MASKIEDYAIIGNRQTAALVAKDGSIDWLGFPRFDSDACFAALLGAPENGRWHIGPADDGAQVSRCYRDGTLVLETRFTTPTGSAVIVDCMTRRDGAADVLRLVCGEAGEVAMTMELIVRFGYGAIVPWVTQMDDGRLSLVAGPERLVLATPVEARGEGLTTRADFTIGAGQELLFALTWSSSFGPIPDSPTKAAITADERAWRAWSSQYKDEHAHHDAVRRSLITLKALTYEETGGIVAAATTSLPEKLGGSRNWDYRYCWLRDSTFTLYALLGAGFTDEARAWREWLLRAAAGSPAQMQIMYGVAGERRLAEFELDWLNGYEESRPVRIGNAASDQLQLDIYGELVDSLYTSRRVGLAAWEPAWNLEKTLLEHLATIWDRPDQGIWEVRGPARHFTHSKVMAWVAFDRAVKSSEDFAFEGPVDKWRALRQIIHDQVCARGFDEELGSFVQFYGAKEVDAALLMIPLVGFLKSDDPRVTGTIRRIEERLLHDGFVARYDTARTDDGLDQREGVFLACSFWLADNYILQGRFDEATALFERLLSLRNDVGLLSEEYDPASKRLLGNFPQAFSHVALANTAHNLGAAIKPAEHRGGVRDSDEAAAR